MLRAAIAHHWYDDEEKKLWSLGKCDAYTCAAIVLVGKYRLCMHAAHCAFGGVGARDSWLVASMWNAKTWKRLNNNKHMRRLLDAMKTIIERNTLHSVGRAVNDVGETKHRDHVQRRQRVHTVKHAVKCTLCNAEKHWIRFVWLFTEKFCMRA